MIAICERTSIETAVENVTNFSVYAVIRLFSIIDILKTRIKSTLKRNFMQFTASGQIEANIKDCRVGWLSKALRAKYKFKQFLPRNNRADWSQI